MGLVRSMGGHVSGEIWLDGTLVRKDGLFVPNDLLPLNPDAFL